MILNLVFILFLDIKGLKITRICKPWFLKSIYCSRCGPLWELKCISVHRAILNPKEGSFKI